MIRRPTLLAVLAAAALGLAACGDDSDDGGGGGSAAQSGELGKAELVKEAGRICDDAEKALKAVQTPKDLSKSGEAQKYFSGITKVTEKLQSDLEAVKPADEVADDWNAFVAEQRKGTELLSKVAKQVQSNDLSAIQQLSELDKISRNVATKAGALGLKGCGE
jgi:hypothetical protein